MRTLILLYLTEFKRSMTMALNTQEKRSANNSMALEPYIFLTVRSMKVNSKRTKEMAMENGS